MYSRKPSLNHLRVMGCLCYAKNIDETDKLQPRTRTIVLMGYSKITRAPTIQQLPTQLVSRSKPRVEPTRKSIRTSRPPIWKKDFISLSLHNKSNYPISYFISYDQISPKYRAFLLAFSSITEHQSYTEAAQDLTWIEAMQAKINALQENNTWEIVSLPEGKKQISCK
ncbi:uncharacterized protein [Nicotiana tomentosiformis]|uniref:uncharacterized protein n=1 Tax=Nicotiana tomentosiformis TaxID=4098 RepID=UPI00388C958F